MPDDNPYKIDYVNGRKTLSETLEAFAQAVLEEKGSFAYIQVEDTLRCKKCGAPFSMTETRVKTIVEHTESHHAGTTPREVFTKGDRVYDWTQDPQRHATFINVLPADENLAKVELAPGEHELWSLDLLKHVKKNITPKGKT